MANTTQLYPRTPVIALGQVTTANANRDGTGDVVVIVSGEPDGTRIDQIDIVAAGTTTDGMVRLFLYDGTTYRLWKEVTISAVTPSGTTAVFSTTVVDPIILPSNTSIVASTEESEVINVIARGAHYY